MNEMLLRDPQAGVKPLLSDADRIVFLQETLDLFSRRRQGHLIHRCYMTPAALFYGGQFSSAPKNYMKPGEISVIYNRASTIGERARHPDGIIGVENGMGMETALRSKSAPFFSRMPGLHTYLGRDLSEVSVAITSPVMHEELPHARVLSSQTDYLKSPLPKNLGKGRIVMVEFGMTRGNMEGFPEDGFPYHIIKKDMLFHRSQLNEGDIYTYPFDSNQHGPSVEAAYNSYWTTLWARELLWSMVRELPFEGDFDPDKFHFRDIWNAASHGGFNYVIADRKMDFAIAGNPFVLYRGDGLGITNSYKMPVEYAESLAHDTGWKFDLHQDEDQRISMPEFRAC